MNEHDLQNSIRLRLSELGYAVFRVNVGAGVTYDGRHFETGVPKGFSDLFCIGRDGVACFVEVKVGNNRPSAAQMNFLDRMKERGCRCGVAYSVEDAVDIVHGGEIG